MRRPLLFIRIASVLVPGSHRYDWRREWEAEICGAWQQLHERGEEPSAIRAQIWRFARGAFRDAVWQSLGLWDRERFGRVFLHGAQSAGFCLCSLALLILLIAAASSFLPGNSEGVLLPMTRATLLPLPYRDAGRIATVSQAGTALATRSAVRIESVRLWLAKNRLLDGIATYSWAKETMLDASGTPAPVLGARVSDNFFYLLGARTSAGRTFGRDDLRDCTEVNQGCVVLSHGFARQRSAGGTIVLDGRRYRIAAILEKRFWFLSHRIAVWRIAGPAEFANTEPTGVVVRLRPGVTRKDAETEMASILRDAGGRPWDSLVDVSPLSGRVHSVFGSFALGAGLAVIIVLASLRLSLPMRLAAWNRRARRTERGRTHVRIAFFISKTILLLAAVLLCGLEFTRAPSITMLGGTDTLTEPLSTWLFLMGSMGALFWSIHDQRRRCRVCLRRLGLTVHVGCPGCLLLNWTGTELVCLEGHGMLHVPEMVSCWHEPSQWTSLDDYWQGLFQRSS